MKKSVCPATSQAIGINNPINEMAYKSAFSQRFYGFQTLLFSSILCFALSFFPISKLQAQIEYAQTIQPIFNSNCTGCHGGTSGVSLHSYNAVMNSIGDQYGRLIVTPGNAADSPLHDKINPNPQFGSRMPQGGSLNQTQINAIRDWINEGALETTASSITPVESPIAISLHQNYPNPFNPATSIRFTLADVAPVKLEVFTLSGELIAVLSDRIYTGGEHVVRFDATGLSSGVYLYRLSSNTTIKTRTMVLLR